MDNIFGHFLSRRRGNGMSTGFGELKLLDMYVPMMIELRPKNNLLRKMKTGSGLLRAAFQDPQRRIRPDLNVASVATCEYGMAYFVLPSFFRLREAAPDFQAHPPLLFLLARALAPSRAPARGGRVLRRSRAGAAADRSLPPTWGGCDHATHSVRLARGV